MIRILRNYTLTFLLYFGFLAAGIILVAAIPKLELHLLLNSRHTIFLDKAFQYLTLLGDGWFAVIFAMLFILIRYRFALMLLVSFNISGLLAQLIKRILFPGALRPSAYLDQMPDLHLVTGVGLHHDFSFPSGHTTTAFAVLVLAGLISGKRWAAFLLMLLAWLAGFSRIYLSQHFLVDMLAGSLLGLFSTLFFYWYFQGMNKRWLDYSLFKNK